MTDLPDFGADEMHPVADVCEVDEATQTFKCRGCDRWVPWSDGAADDQPDVCDDCYVRLDRDDHDTRPM